MNHGLRPFPGVLAVLIALALPYFITPASTARAEMPLVTDTAQEALVVEFTVSPAELVAPGDATMTFILANQTRSDVKNIYLTSADGLLSESVGQLAAGETLSLTRPHAVTQAELDDGCVRYVLTHDAANPGGEKVTHTLVAPIRKGDARPEVDFTRQFSSRYIAPGGQLAITYRVTNNGNVPVTAICVRDALGDFTGRLERLEVGGTRTFISRVTVSESVESSASLEYSVPSGETVTRTLDPVTVLLSDSALSAEFSVGRSAFDSNRADAVLMLTNTGSDDYTDITVLDDVYGGVIADCITLPSGGSPAEIAHTYPVRGASQYRWRVTGNSLSGEALDFVTDTLTLPAAEQADTVDIQMSVAAQTPKISRPGEVRFDVEIANLGTVTARNLLLYEVDRGNARRLAVLPTGDPIRFTVTYGVESDSTFIFCLNYEDAEGRARTVSADPIEVVITPSGVAPETPQSRDHAPTGISVKFGSSSTFAVLLAVASTALVSMFIILLATSFSARRHRRSRSAEQRRRRDRSAADRPRRPAKPQDRKRS